MGKQDETESRSEMDAIDIAANAAEAIDAMRELAEHHSAGGDKFLGRMLLNEAVMAAAVAAHLAARAARKGTK